MAFKVFTSTTLTAADVNDYLAEQSVIVCTSATRPTPQEGMTIYETDTDRVLFYNGTGWVIVAEPEQTYTPTVTQSGSVTCTVNVARYQRINGRCVGRVDLTTTSAGTAANPIRVSLPVAANVIGGRTFQHCVGVGAVNDASAVVQYRGVAVLYASTEFALAPTSADSAEGSFLGAAVMTAALANADGIIATFDYEMATRHS